ncbi:Mut7-C ubiquitin/RNAse domain-containing protein [Halomonas sp. ATCH28]|uniref:Mut7-C ubiquitin/RNAse domain-containing protein n=1 Tax=Halomonas gemina TaxID=2945105 RepID=A0ABT0T2C2_9GAMM|nr:Mut7-C ubiquitin/RNAse domain-containing protein [Halomonas gemina]MCL7940535.1 Mut7-C ubiquitin/RNAse domain-containing protein [Halomonas gemina]
MPHADFRLRDRLNDFLPPAERGGTLSRDVSRRAAIKDVIESLGVPHTEVDVILVDGAPVGFEHILAGGERVEVCPWTIAPPVARHLRPRPPPCPRFLLDAQLGRLARYLRLLGFDCHYRNDIGNAELAARADKEQRVVLTRDRLLLKRKRIRLAHYVRADEPWQQVEEVCREFDLRPVSAPFTRCTHCNGRLAAVAKEAVIDRLEPLTRQYVDDFLQCEGCGRLYWHGSHVARMKERVERLRQTLAQPAG